jgi:hypothetical protein
VSPTTVHPGDTVTITQTVTTTSCPPCCPRSRSW